MKIQLRRSSDEMPAQSPPAAPRPAKAARPGRVGLLAGAVLLGFVCLIGAILSWGSLYQAGTSHLGQHSPLVHASGYTVNLVGALFALLFETLILGASLRYVGGVRAQRPVAGWRRAAHATVAATIIANIASSDGARNAAWHVWAPAVASLIIELSSRDALGQLREVRRLNAELIPLRLWISAPGESLRTSWRMARTGERSAEVARVEADRCAAARDALRRTLPGKAHRAARRQITRRLWAGSIDPADVFEAIGWIGTDSGDRTEADVLRSALRAVLRTPAPVHGAPSGSAVTSTAVTGAGAGPRSLGAAHLPAERTAVTSAPLHQPSSAAQGTGEPIYRETLQEAALSIVHDGEQLTDEQIIAKIRDRAPKSIRKAAETYGIGQTRAKRLMEEAGRGEAQQGQEEQDSEPQATIWKITKGNTEGAPKESSEETPRNANYESDTGIIDLVGPPSAPSGMATEPFSDRLRAIQGS